MKRALIPFICLLSGYLNAQTLYVPGGTGGIANATGTGVGVGTSTPQFKLDVIGNGLLVRNPLSTNYSTLRLWNDQNVGTRGLEIDYAGSAYAGSLLYGGPTGESACITTTGSYPMTFGTGNTSRMVLRGSSLGIGTILATNPSGYMLAVKGSIGAMSVVVENMSWADYVFDPDYKLPPLSEVQSYVSKNHHLPEIPSTQEIAEKGQDLGQINVLLLKKIEELTLYVIQQQKQIDDLKKSIQK